MDFLNHFRSNLFNVNFDNFDEYALNLFQYQATNNEVYKSYISYLNIQPSRITQLSEIPFLPIEFFKNKLIRTGKWKTQKVFKSSGTTATGRSQHHIDSLEFYHEVSWKNAFNFFTELDKYEIIALLPSYVEQGDSSLIEMINHFISKCHPKSNFHLNNHQQLSTRIEESKNPIMLFGVTYALMDFAEFTGEIHKSNLTLVETGGMKGRKKEITLMEVHDKLKRTFTESEIYSEYGMTELMSQAYGKEGEFRFPQWCKPLVRDLNDPFQVNSSGSGALNLIDLANAHSIAFIETKDLVKLGKDQNFRILGRLDNSDIRGCSLLI